MAKSIGLIAAACVAVLCFSSGAQQEQDAAQPTMISVFHKSWLVLQINPLDSTLGKMLWWGLNRPTVDDGYIINEQVNGAVQYTPVSGEFLLIHASQFAAEAENRTFAAENSGAWEREVRKQFRRWKEERE